MTKDLRCGWWSAFFMQLCGLWMFGSKWCPMVTKRKQEKTKVEAPVVTYAFNTYGADGIKMNTAGRASLPDRLFTFPNGFALWIEFKADDTEEPTPAQWYEIERLRGLGHKVAVCSNKDDGKAVIDWAFFTSQGITYKSTEVSADFAREEADKCLRAIVCLHRSGKIVEAKGVPAPSGEVHAQKRVRRNMGRPWSR